MHPKTSVARIVIKQTQIMDVCFENSLFCPSILRRETSRQYLYELFLNHN